MSPPLGPESPRVPHPHGSILRWAPWGVFAVALGVAVSVGYRRGGTPDPEPGESSSHLPSTSPGASSGPPGIRPIAQAASPIPTNPDPGAEARIRERLLQQWRTSILVKNAEGVFSAERAFLADRPRFHEGLVALAEKDPEERVRSFSTRELGKFALAGDVDLFTRLLENDPSPYVRQNAAWALGELGQKAPAETLKRISQGDPDEQVRSAAATALGRLR